MNPESLAFAREPFGALLEGKRGVHVQWLGTAGFAITHGDHTILIDPYVTRASLAACASGPLVSDTAAVYKYAPRADAIVVGHTHFDHALDVPAIARHTGATVFGSRSASALCRAAGIAESKVRDVESAFGAEPVTADVGPFTLRFHRSAHSRFLFGRTPALGDIADCDDIPLGVTSYRCGAVFGVEIRVAGRTLFHLGSAEILDASVRVPHVDLALVCVAGWTTSPGFPERVMRALSPRAILLSHWDNFLSPFERTARALPGMQMPRLVDRLIKSSRDATVGTVKLLEAVVI